jgi:vitamin B12 transporter
MTTKTLSLITATLLLSTQTFADEIALETITVTTANKTAQSLADITSNIDVITASDIEERGFTTVTEALSHIAGISFTANGGLGGTSAMYLRGMDSRSTLVLIDGIRYNDVTSLSGAPFEHLMVADIEQIEIVKGAQSGIWGADASAGVINIISKKAKDGTHGSAHIEAGSFSTQKYGATLSHKTQDYSIKVSHNVVDTEGFTAQAPKGSDIDLFENDGYTNKTTNIQLSYNINETNKIEIFHSMIDAEGDYDTFENPDALARSTIKEHFTAINFNHVDSFNTLNVYAKRSKFEREFHTEFEDTLFKGSVDEIGFNSKIPYGEGHFVLLGAEYKSFEQDDNIAKDFDNSGIFISNHNTFAGMTGGKTILTESLRYDSYSSFDNELTGKIGLKHIHGRIKGLVTSINYGTAYTVPTLYQLYAPASNFGGFSYPIGNEDLQPETTKSFDISIAYKDFSLTYFKNTIDNLIDSTSGYNNVEGESKIDGIEASYLYAFNDDLLFNINYTKLFNAEDKEGEALLRRATDTLNASIDYYGISKLHLGVDASYVGDRTDIIFNPDFTTSQAQTGNYTLVNFTADYQITDSMQVYGKIENLTDELYQSVYGYATSPRGFYVGVRAKF